MTSQIRNQSVAVTRSPFSKSGRFPITKGRMCQRYVRNYQINPRKIFPCSRDLKKIKYELYITVKHSYIIVNRNFFT
jgi:uncharacterized metal-binding protein YceD (DUF177 family)